MDIAHTELWDSMRQKGKKNNREQTVSKPWATVSSLLWDVLFKSLGPQKVSKGLKRYIYAHRKPWANREQTVSNREQLFFLAAVCDQTYLTSVILLGVSCCFAMDDSVKKILEKGKASREMVLNQRRVSPHATPALGTYGYRYWIDIYAIAICSYL